MSRRPQNRQHHQDAAWTGRAMGDRGRAVELAEAALDTDVIPLPSTRDDFHFDGMANWILGRQDRAEYDFERSGRRPMESYRPVIR